MATVLASIVYTHTHGETLSHNMEERLWEVCTCKFL